MAHSAPPPPRPACQIKSSIRSSLINLRYIPALFPPPSPLPPTLGVIFSVRRPPGESKDQFFQTSDHFLHIVNSAKIRLKKKQQEN